MSERFWHDMKVLHTCTTYLLELYNLYRVMDAFLPSLYNKKSQQLIIDVLYASFEMIFRWKLLVKPEQEWTVYSFGESWFYQRRLLQ